MSIAQRIIGKKAPAPAPATESVVETPLTPMELIDAVAEAEFLPEEKGVQHDTTGVGGQQQGGSAPKAMKDGKSGKTPGPGVATVAAKAKKEKGQVADTPKDGGNPVGYGKS